MKRSLILFIALLALCLTLVGCNVENNTPHEHTPVYVYASAPTCAADGNVEHWRCTGCGKTFADSSLEIELEQIAIPAEEHKFSLTWSYDANYHWHASTCGHDAVADRNEHVFHIDKCTVCGLPTTEETQGMKYTLNEDGSSYTLASQGRVPNVNIIIPAYVDGLPVTAIGDSAFRGQGIASVVIPDTVVAIGDSAFISCSRLRSVTFGNSLKSIGRYAFGACRSLGEMILPDGLTTIGEYAFSESSITSIVVPDSVTDIDTCAFLTCRKLENVVLSNSLTEIKSGTFKQCESLKSINIPAGITKIGAFAFEGVSGIETLYLEDISAWCAIEFNDGSVPTFGLKSLYVNGSVVDGELVIPQNTEHITDYAFYGCAAFSTLIVPHGVTSIGKHAFSQSATLKEIIIADSVTSIGKNTFNGCENLKKLEIPYSSTCYDGTGVLEKILDHNYTNLQELTLTTGTEIYPYAFSDFNRLKTVNLPDGITSIGNCAFEGCTYLSSINLPQTLKSIGDKAFYKCGGFTTITIPESVQLIGKNAFNYCFNLKTVVFMHDTWYCTTDLASETDKTQVDTSVNEEQNAIYLEDTYRNYFWVKE